MKKAAEIRNEKMGKNIFLTAHIHMITPCRLSPPCKYCSISSNLVQIRRERDSLTMEEIKERVKFALRRKEITSITLVGGSDLRGHDQLLLNIVKEIRRITNIELAVDIGAPISVNTLKKLKENNVTTVYSSLETANEVVFRDAKPGDSLEKRIKLMEDLDDLGMNIGTIIMNGLGTMDDVHNTINFLRKFKNLKYLYFSTFSPVNGTPWEKKERASILDTLKFIEHSREIFQKVHIGLADVEIESGSISDLLEKELEVGAGNTFAGMLMYKNSFMDYTDRMLKLERSGYHILRRDDLDS